MSNRDPLPVIRKLYRQHADRPEITASFLANQAMRMLRLAADDPERERYRTVAADWLHYKFDPLGGLSRTRTVEGIHRRSEETGGASNSR